MSNAPAPPAGLFDLEAGNVIDDGEVSVKTAAKQYHATGVLLGQVHPDCIKDTRQTSELGSCSPGSKRATELPAKAAFPAAAEPASYPPPLRSALKVIKPFFFGRTALRRAWLLAFGMVLILIGDGLLMVWFSYLQREYTTALSVKDADAFYGGVIKFVILIALAVPLLGIGEWLKGSLCIEWRRHLTGQMLRGYMNRTKAFYRLKLESGIDNPDQRICQDVGDFTRGVVETANNFLTAVVTLISGSSVLVSISPGLFGFLCAYCAIGTLVMLRLFGVPLMRLQRKLLGDEASMRFSLVRLRENAEAVAFYEGADCEFRRTEGFFKALLALWYRKLNITIGFASFNRFYTMFTLVLPGLVLGPAYLRGEVDFGAIAQVSFIFSSLLTAMMTIATQMDAIAVVLAEASRINQLKEALDALEDQSATQKKETIQVKELPKSVAMDCSSDFLQVQPPGQEGNKCYTVSSSNLEARGEGLNFRISKDVNDIDPTRTARWGAIVHGIDLGDGWLQVGEGFLPMELHGETVVTENVPVRLRLANVSLRPPVPSRGGTEPLPATLVSDISVLLRDGESLLICGESGMGKSSLLRAIAGLWSFGSGSVERCGGRECFFLPQMPYMCLGSLRQQALYPDTKAEDAEIVEALRAVHLEHLVQRYTLDQELDFGSVLSLGEQQRLGFTRLLLRRGVRLALLDESTSALDEQNEALLYELLRQRVGCFVSVGHRPQLLNFHSHRLLLRRLPDGVAAGQVTRS